MKTKSIILTLVTTILVFGLTLGTGHAAQSIKYGQTIGGSIAAAAQIDQFKFQGTAGQLVLVTVYGVWPNGCCNTHYAVGDIYDPNGRLVGTCENTPISLLLTNTGTYLILVHADNYATTGGYGINVSLKTGLVGPQLVWGGTTSGALTGLAESDTYTFYAQSNAIVLLTATGNWPNGCCDTHYAVGDIYDPNGILVGSCENTTTSPLTLTNTGLYTFLIHSDNYARTGSYSLGLSFIRFPGPPWYTIGQSNGLAVLNLFGNISTRTIIQYKTNMSSADGTWLSLTNFSLPTSPYQFLDLSSTNVAMRFYHVAQ